jgi:spore germination cell wall hydrolase CwlJ-like protein
MPRRVEFRDAAIPLAILSMASLAGCAGFSPFHSMLSARECMTRVMYFESNRSSEDGMLAVGTVVMNRLESGRYPRTVCGVVGQPGQFAPGALTLPMRPDEAARARRIADAVLHGARHPGVGKAMFFHTAGYTFPYTNMHYVLVAGGNAFYEKVQTPRYAEQPSHPHTMGQLIKLALSDIPHI